MWSIPTRRKPIPKFTASVYFTYDVSKIKPKVSVKSIIILFCLFIIKKNTFFFINQDKIVDLTYVFETQKYVHYPGTTRFRQEWLIDIINMKENVIKDCKF